MFAPLSGLYIFFLNTTQYVDVFLCLVRCRWTYWIPRTDLPSIHYSPHNADHHIGSIEMCRVRWRTQIRCASYRIVCIEYSLFLQESANGIAAWEQIEAVHLWSSPVTRCLYTACGSVMWFRRRQNVVAWVPPLGEWGRTSPKFGRTPNFLHSFLMNRVWLCNQLHQTG